MSSTNTAIQKATKPDSLRTPEEGELVSDAVTTAQFHIRTLSEARELAKFISKMCPEPEIATIGLYELMINAIEHGNLGITYDQKSALLSEGHWRDEVERRLRDPLYGDRFCKISVERSAHAIRIEIQDEGDGFDPGPFLGSAVIQDYEAHGRGIRIARNCGYDSLVYEDDGRRVIVTAHTGHAAHGTS